MPVAKANTQLDLDCISIQRDLINEPVTLYTSEGHTYRLESAKIEKMAKEALKLKLDGHAPDDLGPGRLIEILQKILDNTPEDKPEHITPEDKPEQGSPSLSAVVDGIADKLATHFEVALKKALQRRQKDILLNASEVLLG